MRTVVWIPYRETRDRGPLFRKVYANAEQAGYPIIVADSGHEPFSVANSWNKCAAESGDWDVAIRWGADFIIDDIASIHAAVEATVEYDYVHAFDKVTKLSMGETRKFLRTGEYRARNDLRPFGGISAITRDAFETVGGYDTRFIGWGHEDRAFRYCLNQLCGPEHSVEGRMVMLRHEGRAHLPAEQYYQYQQYNYDLYLEYAETASRKDLVNLIESRR